MEIIDELIRQLGPDAGPEIFKMVCRLLAGGCGLTFFWCVFCNRRPAGIGDGGLDENGGVCPSCASKLSRRNRR